MHSLLVFLLLLSSAFSYAFDVSIEKEDLINKDFYRASPWSSKPPTHEIALNIYHFPEEEDEYLRLLDDLQTAQALVGECNIRLVLTKKHLLTGDTSLREFESLEFNGGKISEYEWSLFSLVPQYSNGIFLIESLDWTIGENGTVAVGYAPYILELEILETKEEEEFLVKHMSGHSVLGRARSSHTLAHELGHSLFNLRHVGDPTNIMYPYGFGRSPKARFSTEQCQKARSHQPWVKPL